MKAMDKKTANYVNDEYFRKTYSGISRQSLSNRNYLGVATFCLSGLTAVTAKVAQETTTALFTLGTIAPSLQDVAAIIGGAGTIAFATAAVLQHCKSKKYKLLAQPDFKENEAVYLAEENDNENNIVYKTNHGSLAKESSEGDMQSRSAFYNPEGHNLASVARRYKYPEIKKADEFEQLLTGGYQKQITPPKTTK